jgi:hypothetical protein
MLDLLIALTAAANQPMPHSARAPLDSDCRPVTTMMSIGNSAAEAQPVRPRSKGRTQTRRPSSRPCMILAAS